MPTKQDLIQYEEYLAKRKDNEETYPDYIARIKGKANKYAADRDAGFRKGDNELKWPAKENK